MKAEGLVYFYDGSFAGLLCCAYECRSRGELPAEVLLDGTPTLYPGELIATDREYARTIWTELVRMGGEAAAWVKDGWLSCVPEKERLLLAFIEMAYQYGPSVCARSGDAVVSAVWRAVYGARHEAHMYTGFVRFAEYDGILAAQISPKAMVLPLLAPHFADRFSRERFLIHDDVHGEALFSNMGKYEIHPVKALDLAQTDANEQAFQQIWKRYCRAVSIEGRENLRCQRTNMPKRYWRHMVEMQDQGTQKG